MSDIRCPRSAIQGEEFSRLFRLCSRMQVCLALIESELALLQIRDQVSDAICVSDVDENDFSSIGSRRRELDAAYADQSGEAMLGYIDAPDVFHPNFVTALNN